MTLDEMVKLAEDQARRILIGTREELTPMWLLSRPGEVRVVATPWGDNDQKHLTVLAMRAMMREEQVHAYSFLVEAWSVHERTPKGTTSENFEYSGPPPSERPDRSEAVMITAEDRYGGHRNRSFEIIRDKKGRCAELKRLDHPEDTITGIFDGLLGEKESRQ
jgi:hypothetical protein